MGSETSAHYEKLGRSQNAHLKSGGSPCALQGHCEVKSARLSSPLGLCTSKNTVFLDASHRCVRIYVYVCIHTHTQNVTAPGQVFKGKMVLRHPPGHNNQAGLGTHQTVLE